MKILKRILPLVLVLVMLVSSTSVASAASASKPEWAGSGKVRSKVYLGEKEIKPSGATIDGEDYFAVKDISKALKDTKKKFNFKFNLDKNTLTFYPGKAYNSKDTGVTVKKNKAESGWTKTTASNRGTKVYINSKKVSMTVFILNNTFYMKLKDIAKIADCGISYSNNSVDRRFKLDVKKAYNGVEDFKADLSKVTTKVVIGSPDNVEITDTTGIIKPIFDVKLVKAPKTVADFEKLIKYMIVNNIITCSVETNVSYEDIYLKGSVYDNANTGRDNAFKSLYHGVIGTASITVVGTGTNCKIKITLKGNESESNTALAKKNKEYHTKLINALQGLIDSGKLKPDMTEKKKAKAILNWVADNVTYTKSTTPTLYSAVMEGKANCNGYTSIYNMLCRHVGLYDLEVITGTDKVTGTGHAWTAQVLDGKKVMTDATFYDTVDKLGWNNDGCFAQSIKTFKEDHSWDEAYYPEWK